MKVTIIDGQGGRIGAMIVEQMMIRYPEADITAIGTNTIATSAMLKAGAKNGATGENPVIRSCRTADIIIGPIGITMADALLGEVTPAMAAAVGSSEAYKILIPMNKCNHYVVGVQQMPLNEYIAIAMDHITAVCKAD